MSSSKTLTYMGAIVGLLLGSGVGARVAGQVPPQPPKTDTAAKKPVVSDQRVKVQKGVVKTAGGEVKLAPCPVDQDSVDRALNALRKDQFDREQHAREAQRLLDSASAALQVSEATDRVRSEFAAARQKQVDDSIEFARKSQDEAALARKRHLARGFYIGLAGGASTPQRDTRNGYTGGWNTTIPFGWDASDSPFGIRTDFAVDHLNGSLNQNLSAATTAASGDITVWSLNADLKLRAHAPGTTRSHVYLLGGVGAHRVAEGVYGTTGPLAGQNLKFSDAKTNFGWNVGAGMTLEWKATELFVESRFFQVKTDLPYHMNGGVGTYASFTPIVVGLTFF
jgi:opacity protein-like surface antigen